LRTFVRYEDALIYGVEHAVAGDVDDSMCVDQQDLDSVMAPGIWLTHAVPQDDPVTADLNQDGWVNYLDLAEVLENWGTGCLTIFPPNLRGLPFPTRLSHLAHMDWATGVTYPVGSLVWHNDILYKAVQAHTSQADWVPPSTPALWARPLPEAVAEWTAQTEYDLVSLVTHDGQTYRCVQAHTSQVGWIPPALPALWSLVE
jgi:hypothetical protein